MSIEKFEPTSSNPEKEPPSLWGEYVKTPAGKKYAQLSFNELSYTMAGKQEPKENVLDRMKHYADMGNVFNLDFKNTGDLKHDAEALLTSMSGQEKGLAELQNGADPRVVLQEYRDIAQKIIDSGDMAHTYSAVAVKLHINKLLNES